MGPAHPGAGLEIGNRAGDTQDAVIATGRQPHAVCGLGQKLRTSAIGCCYLIQELAFGFGIAAQPRLLIAGALQIARRLHPCGHLGAAFGRRRQAEIRRRHRGHIDMDIDAVQQWAGDLGLIIPVLGSNVPRDFAGYSGI